MWNFFTCFHTFYVHINVELFLHASYIYTVKKNKDVKFFSIPVVRDIGADFTSQIISVKIKVVKVERAKRTLSGLITIIFYRYYLTGFIGTYIIIGNTFFTYYMTYYIKYSHFNMGGNGK